MSGVYRCGLVLASALIAILAVSCSSDSLAPSRPAASITCQLGCIEQDPHPSSPGVFLGSGVDDVVCFNDGQTDADVDGLGDFCEKNLAAAFSPQLALASSDRTDREPHWAARPTSTGVEIAYLLSYYTDDGPDTAWCSTNVQEPFTEACSGHFGDSEVIALEVYYNEAYQHWILGTARYSAHTSINVYSRGSNAYPTVLYFPSHAGAYPRAYVAYSKHANYASDAECDAGAIFGSDTCIADTYERVFMPASANIGSRSHHFSDCMASSNPILSGNGIQECYWTVKAFSGWSGGAPTADPYSTILTNYGF